MKLRLMPTTSTTSSSKCVVSMSNGIMTVDTKSLRRAKCVLIIHFQSLFGIAHSLLQGKAKAGEESDASMDSMMMDVDNGGSDFEQVSDRPPPKTKGRAAPRKAAAPKKAPARGKKAVAPPSDDDGDEIEEEVAPPKRTNRAAVLRPVLHNVPLLYVSADVALFLRSAVSQRRRPQRRRLPQRPLPQVASRLNRPLALPQLVARLPVPLRRRPGGRSLRR